MGHLGQTRSPPCIFLTCVLATDTYDCFLFMINLSIIIIKCPFLSLTNSLSWILFYINIQNSLTLTFLRFLFAQHICFNPFKLNPLVFSHFKCTSLENIQGVMFLILLCFWGVFWGVAKLYNLNTYVFNFRLLIGAFSVLIVNVNCHMIRCNSTFLLLGLYLSNVFFATIFF